MATYLIDANWPDQQSEIEAPKAVEAMQAYVECLDDCEIGERVAMEASKQGEDGEWHECLCGVAVLTESGWAMECTIRPDNHGPLETEWLPQWQRQ